MKSRCLFVLALAVALAAAGRSHFDMGPVRRFEPEVSADINFIRFSNDFSIDTRDGNTDIPAFLRADADAVTEQLSIIQFRGPIDARWRSQLRRAGIETFGYLAPYAVLARLGPQERERARAFDFVRWVGPFHPGAKLQGILLDERSELEMDVLLIPGADEEPALAAIAELGGSVEHVTRTDPSAVIRFRLDVSRLPELAALEDVLWVQKWTEPEVCNNNAQWVTQTGRQATAPPDTSLTYRNVWRRGLRGRGLILSTTDTGLNVGHDMFRDPAMPVTAPGIWPGHRKVVAFKLYAGANAGEASYHGSHVNGTVAGNDGPTGGSSYYDGMAPDARLYFVDLSNSSGGFVIPTNFTALWDTVYSGRGLPDSARPIVQHSGSWGWLNSQGTYLIQDASTDNFSWAHKDFTNIIAAGNESSTRRIRNPGIAKNVLTVGATQNGTSSNAIASFSSRGPTQDNRRKPNVMAPGTAMYSAQAAPSTNGYQSMQGTSMATPAVNGTVGLMRAYLREGFYPTGESVPAHRIDYISSALMRAMAMVSADPNVGTYTVPDNNIGWGRIDADSVLYFAGQARRLLLKDDTSGVATGEYKEYQFEVNAAIPLRVMLAWTDTAAAPNANPTIVNNLNLELVSPSAVTYRGNQFSGGQSVANPAAWDNINVEEGFRVNSPALGVWTMRVYGQNVATRTKQPFAWALTGGINFEVKDVGCTRIIVPEGMVDSGSVVVPACSVYNYGTTTETYNVRMKVGSVYNLTAPVVAHAPGTSRYIVFPDWAVNTPGSFSVTCSTELASDASPDNDRRTGDVFVRAFDAQVLSIDAPAGTVPWGAAVPVRVTVRNNGNTTHDIAARFRIPVHGYDEVATAPNVAPEGGTATITFPGWTASGNGVVALQCSTELAGDVYPDNDRLTGTVFVQIPDVGVISIFEPQGEYESGTAVLPVAIWRNHGAVPADFSAWMFISDPETDARVYSAKVEVAALPPGADVAVTDFPACTLALEGDWRVRCSTAYTADMNPANDTKDDWFRVLPAGAVWPEGWHEVASLPTLPTFKPAKDGAWLAVGPDKVTGYTLQGPGSEPLNPRTLEPSNPSSVIYAGKGNKTTDFYVYDPADGEDGTWQPLAPIPDTIDGRRKPPSKGTRAVSDGVRYLYLVRGNNTLGFWRYDIEADRWERLTDVPAGSLGKRVKGGEDLVYVDDGSAGWIYLLKGQTNEFYRYNTESGEWDQSLPPVPYRVKPKYEKGSFLVYDETGIVYAHQARQHDGTNHYMFRFDIAGLAWDPDPLKGIPVAGLNGGKVVTKKSRDGGSGAFDFSRNGIFALKGGNTQSFYFWNAETGEWSALDTIPGFGSTMKKKYVKAGGDLVGCRGALFAFKGNKTSELWRYVEPTTMMAARPDRDGVAAGRVANGEWRVAISPNPLVNGWATLRFEGLGHNPKSQKDLGYVPRLTVTVFDAAGRSVFSARSPGHLTAGSLSLDLRGLSNGVYLVKLESGGFTQTQALVLQ